MRLAGFHPQTLKPLHTTKHTQSERWAPPPPPPPPPPPKKKPNKKQQLILEDVAFPQRCTGFSTLYSQFSLVPQFGMPHLQWRRLPPLTGMVKTSSQQILKAIQTQDRAWVEYYSTSAPLRTHIQSTAHLEHLLQEIDKSQEGDSGVPTPDRYIYLQVPSGRAKRAMACSSTFVCARPKNHTWRSTVRRAKFCCRPLITACHSAAVCS